MSSENTNPVERLRGAMEQQRAYLRAYEQRAETLTYETLRGLDDIFCRDLMEPYRTVSKTDRMFRDISTWGINNALARLVPQKPTSGPFRDFASRESAQSQVDDFLFSCGALELASRYEGWLTDGIVEGEVQRHPGEQPDEAVEVLILRKKASSYFEEGIGFSGLRSSAERIVALDRGKEMRLERQHRRLKRELASRVELVDGWRVNYVATPELDAYFLDWARLYLRRMYSQELIGAEDLIGGRPFSDYVEVLSRLSGRSQMRIAFAAILKARHPTAHLRNLLTSYCGRADLVQALADDLDAELSTIESILSCLTLGPDNLATHTAGGDPTWAPIVQASEANLILPVYGIDINPFAFLLADLRARHERDWFRVANRREERWLDELEQLFVGDRWKSKVRNLRIREGGRDITDIDFVVYDQKANELGLFQLKWQQPIGMDNRARRSAGRNLVGASNKWIEDVLAWLDRLGAAELCSRLRLKTVATPKIHLLVLGRYHAHFSGFDEQDSRAVWSDWAHFQKVRLANPKSSVSRLISDVRNAVTFSRSKVMTESIAFPLGDLSVILNPTRVPPPPAGSGHSEESLSDNREA